MIEFTLRTSLAGHYICRAIALAKRAGKPPPSVASMQRLLSATDAWEQGEVWATPEYVQREWQLFMGAANGQAPAEVPS